MKLTRFLLCGLAIAAASSAALAQTAAPVVAEAPLAAVKIPFGDWIMSALQVLNAAILPVAVPAAAAAIYKVFPAARLFLSAQLVERLVRNATAYGLNAVEGAVKGKTLSVPVGSAVLAESLQYGVSQAPAWLLKLAGGEAGLAEKIFRSLDLAPNATAARLIAPALGRVDTPIDLEDDPGAADEPAPDPFDALRRRIDEVADMIASRQAPRPRKPKPAEA